MSRADHRKSEVWAVILICCEFRVISTENTLEKIVLSRAGSQEIER
jgi:hypothetical protein